MATSTARIMMLSVFLTTLPLSKQGPSKKHGIGEGFFLPDKNILGGDFTEGSSVFNGIQDSCFVDHLKGAIESKTLSFNTTSEFRKVLEGSVNVGGTYVGQFTVQTTVSVIGKISSGETNAMSGMLLRNQHLMKYTRMTHDCMIKTPFHEELLKDLKKLPRAIQTPENVYSWNEYKNFLKKYGSHVLTTIHYGTRMVYWVISESSGVYSQSQFEMNICAKLQADVVNFSLVNCKRFKNDQLQEALNFKMSKSVQLMGGKSSTRSQLEKHLTPNQLNQFMQEAKTNPGAVFHEFKPIWEVVQESLGSDDEDYNTRLLNLEQYYEGMLDFGCSCQADGTVSLRKFFLDNDKPTYSCRIPPLGCRNDDDCHFSWGSCYCHGESCVDGTDITKIFDTKKRSRFIRREKIGSTFEGINKDCKLTFKGCRCNNTKKVWTKIWQPTDRLGRSLADNGKVALDMKITFSLSGETSPSKNTIIEAITDVFKSYIFDLLYVRVENITKSGQISVRVKFGTNVLKTTIPEKDFRRAIKNKYGRPGELGINPDTINVEYFGVNVSGWTVQPRTCADGTTLKTRQCTEKELKCNGITKDNCVDYYVPSSNKEPIPTAPPTEARTVTPREPQCDPCMCKKRPITSSGVTHTVFNFLFIAPLILLAWFRG